MNGDSSSSHVLSKIPTQSFILCIHGGDWNLEAKLEDSFIQAAEEDRHFRSEGDGASRKEQRSWKKGNQGLRRVVVMLQLIHQKIEGQRARPRSDEGDSGITELVEQIGYPSQHSIADDAEKRSREILLQNLFHGLLRCCI